jgi:DNA-binding SARP family transcriptional activator/TolB-like protein/Tfp pilus assembly protein PilF
LIVTSGVRLKVLGGFDLRVDGQEGPPLPRKTRALLTVLAMDRGRPVGREWLGELLWPGSGPRQVSGSLREALYQLRRPLRDRGVVVAHDGCLALGDRVATDLEDFNRPTVSSDLASLRSAANAYAGPLLAGFPPLEDDFNAWLSASRTQLEDRALAIMARIGDLCAAAGDAAGAMAAAERMFAIDPLREDIHWRLLESCAAAGRRADALRHYATIVEALKRGLDTVPGAQTRAIVQRLRGEMDPAAAAPLPHPQPTPRGSPPSIAVLPFTQLGDEAVPSHLADGILVDTVCQLAGLREVQVISHGSTLAYRGAGIDLRQAGRELGARYVVRGAMRRRGNALRLTTELADAATGAVVWARTHDTTATLDFADQDRLVAQIVNTLAPRVQELELRRIRGKRPESLTTYERVLLAREHLMTLRRDEYEQARILLTAAIAAEPTYGEAYALLADYHGIALTQGWLGDRAGTIRLVGDLTRKALDLDRDNCRALMFQAHRRSLLHRDFDDAMRLFDQALGLWPGSAHTWAWSSYTWAYVGQPHEAIRRVERAMELSPRDREAHQFHSAMCVAHYVGGNFAEAADWGQRAADDPAVLRATLRWTAASLVAAGDMAKARQVMQRAMREMPGQTVADVVRNSPLQDEAVRRAYGAHLEAAGFPPTPSKSAALAS